MSLSVRTKLPKRSSLPSPSIRNRLPFFSEMQLIAPLETRTAIFSLQHSTPKRLATVSGLNEICIYDIEDEARPILTTHVNGLTGILNVCDIPDGRVMCCNGLGTIFTIDLAKGEKEFKPCPSDINIAFQNPTLFNQDQIGFFSDELLQQYYIFNQANLIKPILVLPLGRRRSDCFNPSVLPVREEKEAADSMALCHGNGTLEVFKVNAKGAAEKTSETELKQFSNVVSNTKYKRGFRFAAIANKCVLAAEMQLEVSDDLSFQEVSYCPLQQMLLELKEGQLVKIQHLPPGQEFAGTFTRPGGITRFVMLNAKDWSISIWDPVEGRMICSYAAYAKICQVRVWNDGTIALDILGQGIQLIKYDAPIGELTKYLADLSVFNPSMPRPLAKIMAEYVDDGVVTQASRRSSSER